MAEKPQRTVYHMILCVIMGVLAQTIYDVVSLILVNLLPLGFRETLLPLTTGIGGIVTVAALLLSTRYLFFKELFQKQAYSLPKKVET